MKIEGVTTLKVVLQYTYLLGVVINSLITRDYIDASMVDKIVDIIVNLNMVYYMRYLIKNYVVSQKGFKKIRDKLCKLPDSNMLLFGRNIHSLTGKSVFLPNQIIWLYSFSKQKEQ